MDFLAHVHLITILSVLLFIASIWVLVIIIQKRSGYMFRAMVFFLLVLLALLYLQQSDAKKYTINDVKLALFPVQQPIYNYHVEKDKGDIIATYYFSDPRPRINFSMDSSGKYFHIKDVSSINRVLSHLKLPPVKSGARELASITGLHTDNSVYRWEEYPLGILIIYRTLCQKWDRLDKANCLDRIIIKRKYRR